MHYLLPSWLFLAASVCVLPCMIPSLPRCSADDSAGARSSDERRIDELIKQLGSEDFQVREAATRRLMSREDAAPALHKALKSTDAEVARRAAQILEVFTRRESQRLLDKLVALGKNGEIDQAVDRLVHRKEGSEEEACWQVMAELAWKLVEVGERDFRKIGIKVTDEMPIRDFRRYKAAIKPQAIALQRPCIQKEGAFVIRGEEVSVESNILYSLVASSGCVRAGWLHSSVIFSGESVEVEGIHSSVIVCDGQFRAKRILKDCFVIARDGVKCPLNVRNCLIITAGSVEVPKEAPVAENTIKEKEATPLGFVKFFDPSQAGIKVAACDGGVRVEEVHEGKRFAQAGLKKGDVVIAIDRTEVGSPDSFRRLLRRKLAEGGEAVFKVRRSDKILEIPVPCKD